MKAEYISHMGDDLTVVNAARVSFDKESEWEPYDVEISPDGVFKLEYGGTLSNRDKKLISYLASHGHWTPFAHPQITIRETVPIFVARQRFKHVVGFTYNEVSRRYVDDEPEFFIPDGWRKSADDKKQGSNDEEVKRLNYRATSLSSNYTDFLKHCKEFYRELIDSGVCPEQARMVLPQSMYTSYYVTGSLAAWARAYKQRIDPHAQKEIQDLAKQWDSIIRPLYPESWEALTK